MKIKNKVLIEFLSKITMSGPQQATEMVFDFSETGLITKKMSGDNSVMMYGSLHMNAFEEYEAINKIGIQYINIIIKFLGQFDDIVDIKVNGNMLQMVGKSESKTKKRELPLFPIEMDEPMKEYPNIELDDKVVMSAGELNKFIGEVQSVDKEPVIIFKTEAGKLILSNESDIKCTDEINMNVKGGVLSKFGEPLINSIVNLNGELSMKLRTNFPMLLEEKTDKSNIKLMIAPRVETDDSKPKDKAESKEKVEFEGVKSDKSNN